MGFDKFKLSSDYDDNNNSNNYVPSDCPFFSEGGKGDQLLQRSVYANAPSSCEDKYEKYEKYEIKKSLATPENDPTSVWP